MTSPQNPQQPHQSGQQPPPIPNPYGPNPYGPDSHHPQNPGASGPAHYDPAQHGSAPYGPGGQETAYPSGWGPYPPAPRRKRQRDSEPGRFTWWDLGATLFYVLGFLSGLVGLIGLLPPVADLLGSADEGTAQFGMFLINGISYAALTVLALLLSGQALWRSIRRFAYLWWLKLLLIPVGWFAMLVLNMIIVVFGLGADPETSENQEAITAMLDAVPFLAAVVVLAMLGPYVEEFFFRHLLIGKLSRYINVWICGAISIVTFPLLHFIPALLGLSEDLTLVAVVPYLTMGMLITVGYIVAGRNLFYAWLLHAFNNFMSLVMAYFVQPWAEDMLDQYENLEGGMALIGAAAILLG